MEQAKALVRIRKKLASQLDCSEEEFLKEGVQYVVNQKSRLPFFQIVALGESIVVSVSKDVKNKVMPFVQKRTREELFECPFLYGQTIGYLPDFKVDRKLEELDGITVVQYEDQELEQLQGVEGFEDALDYDVEGKIISKIALVAKDGEQIIGIAAANEVFEGIWEVGIGVVKAYRRKKVAYTLVNNLSIELLQREIVPLYRAASSNIASQAVAHRSGFMPVYVESYRTYLDGSNCFNELT